MIFNLLERYPLLQQDGTHSHGGGGHGGGGKGSQDDSKQREYIGTYEESYDPLLMALAKLENQFPKLIGSFTAVKLPMMWFGKQLQRYATEAIETQKNTLAFNQDFTKALDANRSKIDGLPGGLKKSMDSVVSFQREGIFSANRETIRLANRMKITGQNVAALININKKMATQGVMTNLQQNNLIASLEKSSLRYGVSTDTLISSINKLGESLTVLGFTGGAAATMQGVKDLAKQFPKHGDLIGELTDQLVTADWASIGKLGIHDDIEKIMAGRSSAEHLKATFERIADKVQGFGAGVTGVAGRRARMDYAGPVGVMANQLVQGFKDGAITPHQEAMENLMSDFRTAFDTLLQPLSEDIGRLVLGLLNTTTTILTFINDIIPIGTILKAFMAFSASRLVWDKYNHIVEKIRDWRKARRALKHDIALQQNTFALKTGTWTSMLLHAALSTLLFFLPNLLGSTSKIADLESERNKIELAKLKRDEGPNRFEEFTRMLINNQMMTVQTLDSARSEEMTEFTAQVVEAIHETTDAVEKTGKPNLRKR